MAAKHITASTFNEEVLQSNQTVLIDFWASWCGPCRMLAPTIEELSNELPDVKVCKVDVDEEQELAAKFNVMSIPTLAVIKNGKVTDISVGLKPKQEILAMLNK